jgi:hypothetical protein
LTLFPFFRAACRCCVVVVESAPQTFSLRGGMLSQFESLRVGQEDIQVGCTLRATQRSEVFSRLAGVHGCCLDRRPAVRRTGMGSSVAHTRSSQTGVSRCHLFDTLFPRRCMCARSGVPSVRITSGDSHQDNCCGGGGEGMKARLEPQQ